jgi:mRNA-degrading endonuclease RelE of RelBE toxin-antitoxin system
MKHFASPAFWQHYRKLPANIRELADKNFRLLKQDSNHPSLHLKKVSRFWSVRVGKKYRALAVQVDEGLIWFWIGTHSEYDKLVGS